MIKEKDKYESGLTGIMRSQPKAERFLIIDDDDKNSFNLETNVTLLANKILQVEDEWLNDGADSCSQGVTNQTTPKSVMHTSYGCNPKTQKVEWYTPPDWKWATPDITNGFKLLTEGIKRFK